MRDPAKSPAKAPFDSAEPWFGRYQVQAQIGSGGSGRVYRAFDLAENGEARALKVVRPEHAGVLRWEFETLRSIRHPNLVRVHELLRTGRAFRGRFSIPSSTTLLVQDYASGEVASDHVSRVGDREARIRLVVRIGIHVAGALMAVHERGLVHGDVKPENFIVSADGASTTLIDLGVAGPFTTGAPLDGTVSGTLDFFAPEAFFGMRTEQTDLFALGASLHDLLTGRRPGPTLNDVKAVTNPRSARKAIPFVVPGGLVSLLDRLLALKAADRPRTASTVRQALVRVRSELSDGTPLDLVPATEATPRARILRAGALPLIGRDKDLGRLVSHLRECLAGEHESDRMVSVSGPPGSGKTRLIEEATVAIQLDAATAASSSAVPTVIRVADPSDFGRLLSGPVLNPAIVVVDCEQMSPGGSTFSERTKPIRQAFDLADKSIAFVLEERTAPERARTIELSRVSDADVKQLLTSLGVPNDGVQLSEALSDSGGLPGRLVRCVQSAIAAEHSLVDPGSLWDRGTHQTRGEPASADLALSDSPLVRWLAVAGGKLPIDILPRDFLSIDMGAPSLLAAGTVVVQSESVTLRSDYVTVVLSALSPTESKSAAREVEAAFADATSRSEEALAARPFLLAVRGKTKEARGAFEAGVQSLFELGKMQRALVLCIKATEQLGTWPAIRMCTSRALRSLGRYASAIDALGADPPRSALFADLIRLRGNPAEALSMSADSKPGSELHLVGLRCRFDLGEFSALALEAERTEPSYQQDARRLSRHNAIHALAYLYGGDAVGADGQQRLDRALRLAASAVEHAERARSAREAAYATGVLALADRARLDPTSAVALQERAYQLARAAGEVHLADTYLLNLGLAKLDNGDLGGAAQDLGMSIRRLLSRKALDSAPASPDPVGPQNEAQVLYNLALSAFLSGDARLAASALAHAGSFEETDAATRVFLPLLQSDLHLRAGDLSSALASVTRAARLAESTARHARIICASRLAVTLTLLGRTEAARHALAAVEKMDRLGADGVEFFVARARVEHDAGSTVEAQASARSAVAEAGALGTFQVLLRANLAAAEVLDGNEAQAALSDARGALDRAALTLAPNKRALLRSVPAYQRALAAIGPSGESGGPDLLGERQSDTDGERTEIAGGRRWRRLAELSTRLTAERRPDRLLDDILDAAIELSGAERAMVVEIAPSGGYRVRAGRTVEGPMSLGDNTSAPGRAFSRSIVERCLRVAKLISTVDAQSDDRLEGVKSIHSLSLRSALVVPFFLRSAAAHGNPDASTSVLYLDDRLRPGAFDAETRDLVSACARISSLAWLGALRLRSEIALRARAEENRDILEGHVAAQALQLSASRESDAKSALVAMSPKMDQLQMQLRRVAPSAATVLISGESGSGKTEVSREIHRLSARNHGPFVIETIAALDGPLSESALFGHEVGAFTGASRRRVGLFEAADGGTIVLEQVEAMSEQLQIRLLRVLQEGEFRPLGSVDSRTVDVRIIATTSVDLAACVRDGAFREDLYYRLRVVPLHVPPLRERALDLPLLARAILAQQDKEHIRTVSIGALEILAGHPWPGNVRELESVLIQASLAADGEIEPRHLRAELTRQGSQTAAEPDGLDLKEQVCALEHRLIRAALDKFDGNQTKAADALGVSRYGLSKMIKRLEIVMN